MDIKEYIQNANAFQIGEMVELIDEKISRDYPELGEKLIANLKCTHATIRRTANQLYYRCEKIREAIDGFEETLTSLDD